MSVKAMADVFEHSPYALGTRLVHLIVADKANDDHENLFWLPFADIARKANVSTDTVARAVKRMLADGYLELVQPAVHHSPAIYHFVMSIDVHKTESANCQGSQIEGPQIAAAESANAPNQSPQTPKRTVLTNQVKSNQQEPTRALPSTLVQPTLIPPTTTFDDFYRRYPRPVAKPAAARAWAKVAREAVAIMQGLEPWLRYWEARNEPEYIPHPATFLNRRGWEDDPPTSINGNGKLSYMSPKSIRETTMIHDIVQANGQH
jgi:hypothetical protein